MAVRDFVQGDIPQVANLYWLHLGPRTGAAPLEVQKSLRELYFCNPLSDGDYPSFVYENKEGEVVGFLGMTTRKMCLEGKPVHVGFGGNFVVHPSARGGLAAPRMLEACMAGPQDVVMTDSANDISRKVLERVGFKIVPTLNIHWARPLKPAQYAVYTLSRKMKPASLSSGIRFAAKPICSIVDGFARSRWLPAPKASARLNASELTCETLLHCFDKSKKADSLRPEYSQESLCWLLRFMERNRKRGDLRKIIVRDENQKTVGWYIYYAKHGAVGEVVQVGSLPEFSREIIRHLLNDAEEHGVIGLHGVADAERIADFSDEGCFFTCRGGWALAYSRDSELMDIFQRGHVCLSRLDGEWCLHPGE